MPPVNFRKALFHYALFFAVLFVFSQAYYTFIITKMPFGMHNWAQADRFSLARNFYDNGMNFFKPATSNLFSKGGITGVEFPIQAYIAACLGFIFGRANIHICFRVLDVFIICVGLFYLFRIVYHRTQDFIFSMVAPLFVFCSPVFIFYGGSFLPDPAGVSLCFIGFYFLLAHLDEGKQKDLVLAIAWFTLAALVKTTVAFFLVVTLAYLVFHAIARKDKRNIIGIFILGSLSGSVLLAWFLYSRYLNKTYESSLFLAAVLPFRNMEEVTIYFRDWFRHKWMGEYMILPQYLFFVMVTVPALYLLRLQKRTALLSLAVLYLLTFATCIYLMGQQMPVHDYYFIAMFFPFAGWLLCAAMIAIHAQLSDKIAIKTLRLSLFTAVLIMFFFADFHNHQRIQDVYPPISYVNRQQWMYNGDKLLDSIGIRKDEKIAVMSQEPPNLALIFFDRKGVHLSEESWGHYMPNLLNVMHEKQIQVLVCRDSLANEYTRENPHYFDDFTLLAQSEDKRVLRLK